MNYKELKELLTPRDYVVTRTQEGNTRIQVRGDEQRYILVSEEEVGYINLSEAILDDMAGAWSYIGDIDDVISHIKTYANTPLASRESKVVYQNPITGEYLKRVKDSVGIVIGYAHTKLSNLPDAQFERGSINFQEFGMGENAYKEIKVDGDIEYFESMNKPNENTIDEPETEPIKVPEGE